MTVTLFGKRGFAGVIKLRISRRDHHGLDGWVLNPTRIPIRKGEDADREEKYQGKAIWKWRQRLKLPSYKSRDTRDCRKLPGARRVVWNRCSSEPPEGTTLLTHWCQTVGLHSCKRINFYCYKPLRLCQFVTVVPGIQ